MDGPAEEAHPAVGRQLIVKADEVDQVGTAIQSPSKQLPLSALDQRDGAAPSIDEATVQVGNQRPERPILRRDGSAPRPPSALPPPSPSQPQQQQQQEAPASDNPPDSLSLPQLKQLVSQFPKAEQRAYAFQYADAQSFPEEIEDWFQYSEQDGAMILTSKHTFEQSWTSFLISQKGSINENSSFLDVSEKLRRTFVMSVVAGLNHPRPSTRIESFELLFYILGGTWATTAGLDTIEQSLEPSEDEHDDKDCRALQIEWMHKGADLLIECSGLQPLFDATRKLFDEEADVSMRKAMLSLKPNFLVYWVDVLARQRWEDVFGVAMIARVLGLFWKSTLLIFGDSKDALKTAKSTLQTKADPPSTDASRPILTASPLDYHLFRQEITSKYPAYNPPLPLVPFELEHKSILPPLPHHPSRANTIAGSIPGSGQLDGNVSGSILHQPVHIATPAPSPPPSPIGPGGKAGKKQNYQTNQNFPFLYPPLDDSSNSIGGKGSTEFQDLMVGKKWEGSDIPVSIIEAGQLFASRMRMTRAMGQLWKERELFLKDDRGWGGDVPAPEEGHTDAQLGNEEEEEEASEKAGEGTKSTSVELEDRLSPVEDFFHLALPNLQSLVIVMMKTMLSNVQQIALQNDSITDSGPTAGLQRAKSNLNVPQPGSSPNVPTPPHASELSVEELNETRLREMCHKAIAGSLFLLLKWFKLSHVLKFEYLTQLLLDSNYIPLVLKYFAHQNLEDLVATKYDRSELGFFHFCHRHSNQPPPSPAPADLSASPPSSPDEAVPPPILRHRRSPTAAPPHDPSQLVSSPENLDESSSSNHAANSSNNPARQPPAPSVDELGNPLAPIPNSPITSFSFRQFQTSIHLLRVLQKISRGKAHRILLLVQYKSSQILRRILRVPDSTLRLYVLKLFKSQVPYCGRKWRQSNMKVITAIYLHCRPELRDDWLAGMHDQSVEGEVDEALPLEWALRGLTFWWMKRVYGDVVRHPDGSNPAGAGADGATGGIEDSERDFFQRELDQMGWGMAVSMGFGGHNPGAGSGVATGQQDDVDAVSFGEEAPGANGIVNGDDDNPNGNPNGNGSGAGRNGTGAGIGIGIGIGTGGGAGTANGGEQWERAGPLRSEAW